MPRSVTRVSLAWASIRDSLWFVPTLATAAGVVLALAAVRIPTPTAGGPLVEVWIFGGGTEGARGVLGAIAGSLITVTGVVFSVTVVALQLASSQFTPRVVGSFVADRVNQTVLGVFIGTFTYTLMVLRTIRSASDDRETFVPHVAVTVALVLLLLSIGALILFIDHAARSMQAAVILERESARARRRIEELFPTRVGEPSGVPPEAPGIAQEPRLPGPPAVIAARSAGYLQAVHAEALWKADAGPRVVVAMRVHIGAFVFPGKAIAEVWPATSGEAMDAAVRDAFIVGPERTHEQDAELGLVELSDIALRALSPGINDPTTAMHAIDRLTQLLALLASRGQPDAVRSSEDGRVRLVALHTTFARALGLAFDQIRHFGADNPTVTKKVLDALLDLASVVPPEHVPAVVSQAGSLAARAARLVEDAADREPILALARRVSEAAERRGAG